MKNYQEITSSSGKIKAWINNVEFDENSRTQLCNIANLPFIYKWVAAMPDVHLGIGATVGSVIPTKGAIIPAAVGVDIGCGMIAVKTSLKGKHLPSNLKPIRDIIELACPHGYVSNKYATKGSWKNSSPLIDAKWKILNNQYETIVSKHEKIRSNKPPSLSLGSLGGGNHFIEVCLDENSNVWFMLHSGSRNIGNIIGRYFIEKAKEDMIHQGIDLVDKNLAYLTENSELFDDYINAVSWAQEYAKTNREIMMQNVISSLQQTKSFPSFTVDKMAINCHHNYVAKENHYDEEVYITRKGAVKATKNTLGIIPGSMGAKSYIVRGKGNMESFCSCSHGAGRKMSRTVAKKTFNIADHIRDTKDIECRKDAHVLDETPRAYKDIDKVMEAQKDLVEVIHTLKQVICVKG